MLFSKPFAASETANETTQPAMPIYAPRRGRAQGLPRLLGPLLSRRMVDATRNRGGYDARKARIRRGRGQPQRSRDFRQVIRLKDQPISYEPFFKDRTPKAPRPRSKVKPVSDKRKEGNKVYEKEKRIWRKERIEADGYLRCEYVDDDGVRCAKEADNNPHHRKRRHGALLCDREWFMAVCLFPHHRHIEDNIEESEKKGYIIREFR